MKPKNEHVGTPYQPPDRTDGSTTSRDAAKDTHPTTPNQRERAWNYVADQGAEGATAQETNAALEINHNCCSRFTELRQQGRLARNGKRRRTENGSFADVLVAVDPEDWKDKRPGWPAPLPAENPPSASSKKLRTAVKTFEEIISRSEDPGLFVADEIADLARRARLSMIS